ncbi:hypothetical protein GGX14DRAFT_655360 [Mycena pura]|uniref:Uncharacterized protein n=1 Tax=Mycena pura TaxID=153505 RepID=A0AAD6V3G4_9AGAR|nr:hypothetical protein GGX14DRAFT_655360 [Mycena pura]
MSCLLPCRAIARILSNDTDLAQPEASGFDLVIEVPHDDRASVPTSTSEVDLLQWQGDPPFEGDWGESLDPTLEVDWEAGPTLPPLSPVPPSYLSIHGEWYTDATLSHTTGWTTDWDDWELIEDFFVATVDGEPRIQHLFRECWGIQDTIQPVAYTYGACGLYFLFSAAGRYYFWSVLVHSKEFTSPKEFLDYALKVEGKYFRMPHVEVPVLPGADLDWVHWLGRPIVVD